jgi:probable HAF family extracellular repeat protein
MTRFHTARITSRIVSLAVLAAAASGPAAAAAAAPAAAAASYTITDLGSLGYGVTDGLAINNNGQVTGYSYLSTQIQVSCPPHQYGGQKKCFIHPYHAFLYSNGTMTDLGTLGGNNSEGLAINLSGQVVGPADTKTGFTDSALWTGKTITDLSPVGAYAINDNGVIAGGCTDSSGSYPCLDSNGTLTRLPQPSNPAVSCGTASAINNTGQAIATCGDTSSYQHAVLWNNGTATDLGTFGGPQASAAAINNNGQVAGWAQTSTDADHGFLYSNGTMTDLGLNFFPAAINDNGVIVGGNEIYSGGTLQDLNNLIPPGSPYQIMYATGINNNGQIVADATDTATSQRHALLLNPS